MADTTTEQVRKAISGTDIDGNTIAQYEIAVSVVDKGDLPDDKIFVISIVDPDNAKGDLFARVASIPDFEDITTDRPTALDENGEIYRTSTFTFLYDNLETAINAQDVLKSRIDELVQDYQDYLASFVASPTAEATVHPQLSQDAFNSLVTSYTTTVEAEATALQTRDDAKDAYDACVEEAATATTNVTDADTALADCTQAKGWFDALYTAMAAPKFASEAETFRVAAEDYRVATTTLNASAEATFATARDTFSGQQATAIVALATAAANQASFQAQCNTRTADVTTATTAKATADACVATSRTSYDDAQTAYENAQQAAEAALAAISALKPDFDPATDIT